MSSSFKNFEFCLKKKIEHEGTTKIERSTIMVVLWKLARLNQGLKAQLRSLLHRYFPPSHYSSTLLYPCLCWIDDDDQNKEPMINTKIIEMGN